MEEYTWMQMLEFMQEVHRFARSVLVQAQKQPLTASELELLSRLCAEGGPMTPLELSRRTGMKKEAVSRCLRQLLDKLFISREKHPSDERSHVVLLTQTGLDALQACYGPILRPVYALRREMGADFGELFRLIEEANRRMEAGKEVEHEIL